MTKVLIIGGGIAGPVTATALREAGIEAVVHEAYAVGADDIGAFLTIMHNGVDALRAIGLDQVVADNSFAADGLNLYDGTGALVAETRWHTDITGPRTLRRSDLYRALHDEAARRGVEIRHGKRLVHAEHTGDGVRATFADGTRAEGDVLVGADGLHSTTRRLLDPAAPEPRYTGLNIFYGYTEGIAPTTEPGRYHMITGGRAFFGHTTAPDGRTWWFARVAGDESHGGTPAEWVEQAAGAFADDDTPAARIVRASGEVRRGNAYDVPSTPVWHDGRLVLVGDAAHAASPAAGQGASMALEDGVVLAMCLRDCSEPRAAFEHYERLRRVRVEALVSMSARVGADRSADSESFYRHHIEWNGSVVNDSAFGHSAFGHSVPARPGSGQAAEDQVRKGQL
ncbi:FAD-dependent monooxygenase [Actinosynnema sp. NPDC047251]|uniref:FAD dependent oxidoreductase n=1 Tax=Saccharothrix espanaensis (strain ATCC 51144 / DSM 44229 / JCM 9112 / NBRC 15066 / NRRL 15764) TaxID=1179773 RepID=K0K366_SACES|nr:FAD-dependent monooxygenase [Saccharothrix espanaensis]CCH34660.1 FAD dependent oxidoreductase [Saccharothrix espanaensis DSM 44229]